MNILEQEDIIKGMPDSALQREARMPSGQVPQYLVVSEIQRRTDMRKKYEAQQPQPQTTVAEQVVNEGISGLMPQPMQTPMAQPTQAPMPPAQPPMAPMMPQRMKSGGITYMQEGGETQEQAAARLLAEGFSPEEIKSILSQMSGSTIDTMVGDMSLAGAPTPVTQGSIPYGMEFVESPRSDYMNLIPSSTGMSDFSAISMVDINNPEQMDMQPSGPKNVQGTSKIQAQSTPAQSLNDAMIALDRSKDKVAGQIGEQFNYFQPPKGLVDMMIGAGDLYRSMTDSSDTQTPAVNPLTAQAMIEAQGQTPQTPSTAASFFDELSSRVGERVSEDSAPFREFLSKAYQYEPESVARAKRGESLATPQTVIESQDTYSLTPELADMYGDIIPSTASDEGIVSVLRSSGVIPETPATSDSPVVNAGGVDPASLNIPDYSSVIDESTLPSREERRTENAFSDLIEEGRRDAMAQALIQLGAGIAGGDLAGGISRAGQAAYTARKDAREAEASRLDKQFLRNVKERELDLMELRLDRALTEREKVALNTAWDKATALAKAEVETAIGLTPEEKRSRIEEAIKYYFAQGAKALGVAVPEDYSQAIAGAPSQSQDFTGFGIAG